MDDGAQEGCRITLFPLQVFRLGMILAGTREAVSLTQNGSVVCLTTTSKRYFINAAGIIFRVEEKEFE